MLESDGEFSWEGKGDQLLEKKMDLEVDFFSDGKYIWLKLEEETVL